MLLGETCQGSRHHTSTGVSPTPPGHSRPFNFSNGFSLPARSAAPARHAPQPRAGNTCQLEHLHGLASSAFARHYSRNHNCFLFLRVLRCFTSPRTHQTPYKFRRRRLGMTPARLPHSETPGSKLGCQLPREYRRLPRPSSASGTKASTKCPKKLVTNTPTTKQQSVSITQRTPTHTQKMLRVHYAVLKKQPPTPGTTPATQTGGPGSGQPRHHTHPAHPATHPGRPLTGAQPEHTPGCTDERAGLIPQDPTVHRPRPPTPHRHQGDRNVDVPHQRATPTPPTRRQRIKKARCSLERR
jgi:hypothetical protein